MSILARFQVDRPGFRLDVDLTLPDAGVTALYGPSGSGKTTLLRCIAGLEVPPTGYLAVAGEVWQDGGRVLPTHRRPLGYVFQEASLFSHLSVEQNLRFGERRAGRPDAARFAALVELLGIAPLLARRPERLSGGERQRVAIARALLTTPRLLLMDEPLAALDVARKREILPYLERLHRELKIPVLYVSHSPEEVSRLADHLVVLAEGRVRGAGPLTGMLARLDGGPMLADETGVVIEGRLVEASPDDDLDRLSRLDFDGGTLWVSARPEAVGERLRCRVLARDVSLARAYSPSSILNHFQGVITAVADTDNPAHLLVRVEIGSVPLLARITRRSWRLLGLAIGERVHAQVKAVAVL